MSDVTGYTERKLNGWCSRDLFKNYSFTLQTDIQVDTVMLLGNKLDCFPVKIKGLCQPASLQAKITMGMKLCSESSLSPGNNNGTGGITVAKKPTVKTKSAAGERRETELELNKNKQTEAPRLCLRYQRELTGFKTDNLSPPTPNTHRGAEKVQSEFKIPPTCPQPQQRS